jgi:aspartyl-tRNA(Asn)/glutamyl-tRNA(Gln) amidotransferase subunit A
MPGHDPKDSTSADLPVPDFEAMLTGDIRGKVIGIPKEYRMEGMPGEIETLWTQGAEMLPTRARAASTSRCRTRNTPCPPIT